MGKKNGKDKNKCWIRKSDGEIEVHDFDDVVEWWEEPKQVYFCNTIFETAQISHENKEKKISEDLFGTLNLKFNEKEQTENINEIYPLILTPKHSIKGDLLFVEENKWRIGWDYEYKSSQLLSSGYNTRSLFTTGIIVERTIDNFVIFLNAENFTDVRQSRYETSLLNVITSPQFTEVWAPLDGFFFNAGIKIKL